MKLKKDDTIIPVIMARPIMVYDVTLIKWEDGAWHKVDILYGSPSHEKALAAYEEITGRAWGRDVLLTLNEPNFNGRN